MSTHLRSRRLNQSPFLSTLTWGWSSTLSKGSMTGLWSASRRSIRVIIYYAISAHMQRPIVLPYTPNDVALGPKSRYATLSERCIREPCLWPIKQRFWLSNATPKMYCIIHIMQHHPFIKATSPGVAPKGGHTLGVGPTPSTTSAGSHLTRQLSPTWHIIRVHFPRHGWVPHGKILSGSHISFATLYILICNTMFIFATL